MAKFFVIVVFCTGMALFFARDFLRGSNMDERKQYWGKELATLAVAANKTQLEAFAQAHGQILNCYQNYNHEDRCDFDDTQSYGGAESKPMLLSIIFKMNDEKIVSHQFTTTFANQPL